MISSTKFLLLNILYIHGFKTSYGNNICKSNTTVCQRNREHCKFQQWDGPAHHCINLVPLVKTDDDRRALLDRINNRRNKIAAGELRSYPAAANMMKLAWNSKLEQSAQRWANRCAKSDSDSPDIQDACKDSDGVSVGQNIATVFGEAPGLQVTSLVDIWYMELLNNNASIVKQFQNWAANISFCRKHYNSLNVQRSFHVTPVSAGRSGERGPQYEYFTQLVWADSNEVGCGGAQFKERFQTADGKANRTVYRLVCNFSPSGNRDNQSVYMAGAPCSECPNGSYCDVVYRALCSKPLINRTRDNSVSKLNRENTHKHGKDVYENSTNTSTEEDGESYTIFDYFSHVHDFTRPTITISTTSKPECKDIAAMDSFIELLKNKLTTDQIFKELVLAKTTPGHSDANFSDPHVAAFANKIYSKNVPSTTTRTTEDVLINSTLLVDLVEAVIFRSGDKTTIQAIEESTYPASVVYPVKVKAELGFSQKNEDFTGHYFFPEEEEDYNMTETTETYYDNVSPSIADILDEIEEIKGRKITKNFLDDILDLESAEPSTENTTTVFLTPASLSIHRSGHQIMKKFLEDIKEKPKI